MKTENGTQLELFSQTKDYSQIKIPASSKFSFGYIRNYEKQILIIIGFVVTGIISFSLGVEKGKNIAINTVTPTVKTPSVMEKPDVPKQPIIKDLVENYTIQVASYKSKTQAEKEAEALKKKKLLPLVFPKGKYTVVCIGNFPNKETAKSLLTQLRKRYQDCFIRRL